MSDEKYGKTQRNTSAEIEHRVTEVQKLLLEGFTYRQIRNKCCPLWKICSRQVDSYLQKATEEIREINKVERADNLAMITMNMWELFRESRVTGDLSEAHKVLNSIAKLRGLDETTVNHIFTERPLQSMTDEELDQAMEQASLERH